MPIERLQVGEAIPIINKADVSEVHTAFKQSYLKTVESDTDLWDLVDTDEEYICSCN